MDKLEILEKNIGYTFKNKALLKNALTHTSYAYENHIQSNEKLEFLGDSILEFLSSKYIYNNYSKLKEGEMTKVRATVVCEDSLYKIADKHNFSDFLYVGKSERMHQGNRKIAIMADSVEAVIAAIYFDSGLEETEKILFLSIVTGDTWKRLKRGLIIDMKIDVPGTGIAFAVPLASIGGKKTLQYLIQEQPFEKEEETAWK